MRKRRINELFSESKPEFDTGNNKKYEVEAIIDSNMYAKKKHLPDLYYLVFWKSYPKENNTWKPSSAVMHLRKIISTFDQDHLVKPTAISPFLNFALPMAKPSVKPAKSCPMQKQGRPISSTK